MTDPQAEKLLLLLVSVVRRYLQVAAHQAAPPDHREATALLQKLDLLLPPPSRPAPAEKCEECDDPATTVIAGDGVRHAYCTAHLLRAKRPAPDPRAVA